MADLVRGRLSLVGLVLVALLLALVVPLAGPAFAGHGTCEVDLIPEAHTAPVGTTQTITAVLRPAGTNVGNNDNLTPVCTADRAGGPVDISFEVITNDNTATYSPGTIDRADTPLQPDLGCTIAPNQDFCTVSYTRTAVTGADTIEGWAADEPATVDAVTRTWTAAPAPAATFLNVEPETDTNPVQTAHVLTATARDANGNPLANVNVDFEIIAGPNINLDNARADRECTTGQNGTCTVTYTDAAQNPAAPNNVDTICSWIDPDGDDSFNPFGSDATDGGDCDVEVVAETEDSSVPGTDTFGNDLTDVVQKTWAGATLTMTPVTDSASVGTCNPFTITLTEGNNPVAGATIDVEQIHALATNNTADDEPSVGFCVPTSGPNPSDVREQDGDLRENPDNRGTAGGETTQATDAQGQVTIGIVVSAQGSADGTGNVTVTAFREATDNDDPEASEPQDTSTKTWVLPEARTIDCEPETATAEVAGSAQVTCTVRDRFGDPLPGVGVTITTSGPGGISTTIATTDAAGQVTVTASSFQLGTQTITATLDSDLAGAEPGEVDACDRAANDPGGAPAGVCADDVTVTWVAPTTGSAVPQICLDTPGAFIGSDGDDTITGTDGNDVICARGGNDTVTGGLGNDLILGGPGDDVLRGGGGADTVKGGGGNDTIAGGGGSDTLKGGGGNDTITGGRGPDLINGGPGTDTCRGGRGRDRIRRCEH